MATLPNNEITQDWELVSSVACTVQVLTGSVYVSYGAEPTGTQGHLLIRDDAGEESINNANDIAVWVRSTNTHKTSIIAVTESA
jgi:hypothetical protein